MSTGRSLAAVVAVVREDRLRYRPAMLAWIRIAALSCATLGVSGAAMGCGGDINPKTLNEPCTRTEQCEQGLVCLSGVCLEPEDGDAVSATHDPRPL
ncbi:MAG: hypothetical protein AAF997_18135 [Myxococcota bacterium]